MSLLAPGSPVELEPQKFDGCDLDSHLLNWARWMRRKQQPQGLPQASMGMQGYTTIDRDNDQAYYGVDVWTAEHTDAAISSLIPSESCAMYHEYGITSVYRFPRDNYQQVLKEARANVRRILIRRSVVVT